MGRPSIITNEKIINVARGLFLTEGAAVSTAKIAKMCGISEGTLFKRFGDKKTLFKGAMAYPPLDDVVETLRARVPDESVSEAVVRISIKLLSFYRVMMPRIMTIWASPQRDPRQYLQAEESPPKRLLDEVTLFFTQHGSLRNVNHKDPQALAHLLLSAIQSVAFDEITGLASSNVNSIELSVRQVIAAMGLHQGSCER